MSWLKRKFRCLGLKKRGAEPSDDDLKALIQVCLDLMEEYSLAWPERFFFFFFFFFFLGGGGENNGLVQLIIILHW